MAVTLDISVTITISVAITSSFTLIVRRVQIKSFLKSLIIMNHWMEILNILIDGFSVSIFTSQVKFKTLELLLKKNNKLNSYQYLYLWIYMYVLIYSLAPWPVKHLAYCMQDSLPWSSLIGHRQISSFFLKLSLKYALMDLLETSTNARFQSEVLFSLYHLLTYRWRS